MKTRLVNLLVGPAMALTLAVPAQAGLYGDGAPSEAALPEFGPSDSAPAPAGKNGSRAKRTAVQRLVQADPPATANPPGTLGQPATAPLSAEQLDRFMERGKKLMQNGDFMSARLLFLRVAAAGNPRAAMWVGMTYDPDVYARFAVVGLVPDRALAELWYAKAGERPMFPPESEAVVETPPASGEPQGPGSPQWIAGCARKYKSFEPETGLYTTFGGTKRRCRLP